MATAKQVISKITMINNIKYNNNSNTQSSSKENDDAEVITSFSSGLASLSASQPLEEALASSGTLPGNWKGVKLDLFSNPGHTLKITIIRHDGTRFAATSNLNSPRSYVFRGRDQGQGTAEHWQLVDELMLLCKQYDYKISKVGKPRKGGSLKDFVAMIYLSNNIWIVNLVYENKIWNFELNKETSEEFTKKNGIASGYYGITTSNKPWQDPKELGI